MDEITMSGAMAPLAPTFIGHIATTMDAAILFEACLQGRIPHVPRRPHDRERQDLIASGNVFIYEEHASGIKRWTDGVSWSPSRILGNFLIYRELEKPFPPGEKKRALKKKKPSNGGINRPERANSQSHTQHSTAFAAVSNAAVGNTMGSAQASDPERSLVGSLVDSYPFKQGGLIKKTISIHFQGVPHHLVSYYSLDDALNGAMNTPTNDIRFADVRPRTELLMNQNFRNPLDETAIFAHEDRGLIPVQMAGAYYPMQSVPDMGPHGVVMSQSMAVASMPSQQPMHAAYPAALEYEFFSQQQAPHHQALPHLVDPPPHHQNAHQQAQLQHHQYQYESQQHQYESQQQQYEPQQPPPPPHHHHHHHHPPQHHLQSQAHRHGDHQREDFQRHFSVGEMQQPLQSQQGQSPPDQAGQDPQQPQQQPQQQPPSAGYGPQGGPWPYDTNDYYFG